MKMLENTIGKKVCKKSGSPFKSKLKVNTISGIVIHWITGKLAYTFEEDSSIVETKQCLKYQKEIFKQQKDTNEIT